MQGTWEDGRFVLASTKDAQIERLKNELQKSNEHAADEVIEMAICEVPFLMLRPGVLYRFVEMPGCDACAAAAAPYKASNAI